MNANDLTVPSQFHCIREGRVECYEHDGVALIRLNRPDKRNALDAAQIQALDEAIHWYLEDASIRAAVLIGAGGTFCAGGDIEMFLSLGPDNALSFTQNGHALLRRMETGRKPVIAAVTGHCLAGGMELALACDFIVASHTANFGLTEVNLGLIPGWGGTVRIARAISLRMARQLVMTGERISSDRARGLGLVNEVPGDDAQTLQRAIALAEKIADQSSAAVYAVKAVMNATESGGGLDSALALEAAWSAGMFSTTVVQDKVDAWVSGRGRT